MAKKLPEDIKEFFRRQGAKGGKKAAANMTDKQKRERALLGVEARRKKRGK